MELRARATGYAGMLDYDFVIEHIPGKDNIIADHLSHSRECFAVEAIEPSILAQIKAAQNKDEATIWEEWQQKGAIKGPDDVWRWNDVPIVPEVPELRRLIIDYAHRRHERQNTSVSNAKKMGFWSGQPNEVRAAVKRCPHSS
ncbi:DNA/RNA polymerases superfamily protein [Carpediemonas membranifera]|uniref:DNA/RNA polymerases superfamily protein n=1 Tax=Carpediemonas membranifera TaxID=201153 RepID=A0A8J6B1E7_9EUKA|nr:DNA/RNA polymerases superfamily protein [Carpediemonas membranifera]|eukprot:KAG9397235.1 DNA/RNA polymerases superfamily protein [Carpediemonas membranifera]